MFNLKNALNDGCRWWLLENWWTLSCVARQMSPAELKHFKTLWNFQLSDLIINCHLIMFSPDNWKQKPLQHRNTRHQPLVLLWLVMLRSCVVRSRCVCYSERGLPCFSPCSSTILARSFLTRGRSPVMRPHPSLRALLLSNPDAVLPLISEQGHAGWQQLSQWEKTVVWHLCTDTRPCSSELMYPGASFLFMS